MSMKFNGVNDGHVLFTTTFDYKDVNECNAVALIPTDFRILKETSRYLRDPETLNLSKFDLVATDRFAKRYLKGADDAVGTLRLACNEHAVPLVVVVHHAELFLPTRFQDRMEEERFHKKRMLEFSRASMSNHPGIRILPIYIRIINNGETLEYVSFEDLIHGRGREEVVWVAPFSLRGVMSCKYLLSICLDFRYRKESFDFIFSSLKIPYYHLLGTPGSCRGILNGNETALMNVEKAVQAGAEEAVIIQHSGCKAYEDIVYSMDSFEEERYQKDQLLKGRTKLKKMGLKDVFLAYARRLTPQELLEFVVVR